MHYAFHPPLQARPLLLAIAFLGTGLPPTQAQEAAPAALPSVTVSASGLQEASSDMSTSVSVLEDDELIRRREATLGDTLSSEPGIQSTHFGVGASRPVIRGMDGPRVQVLTDGSEVQDASSVSPDHAVVLEPLLARQIEVLRGPSALIHGGGAIGGVVNVLDRRIPTSLPEQGTTGSMQLRGATAAGERTGAFELTGGAGQLAVHMQGLARNAGDYRVGSGWSGGRTVPGSFNHTDTGSLGLSWIADGDHLHCGSHDGHEHNGVEPLSPGDVPVVNLLSHRWDLRLELQQEPVGGWHGVFGLQTSERHFSTLGEEAYLQPSTTRRTSLFVLEQYEWRQWRFEGALRQEHQSVEALGSGLTSRHHGSSASLGAV